MKISKLKKVIICFCMIVTLSSFTLPALAEESDNLSTHFINTKNIALAAQDSSILTVEEIAQKAESVVMVKARNTGSLTYSMGTGFLVSSDGKIITNYHVVEYYSKIEVVTDDEETIKVSKVLYRDSERDIAVLKIDDIKNLKPLELGNSDTLKIGQGVVAIGNPMGYQNTVSTGIVSGIRKSGSLTNIQHTAPVSPGSSGGPLFDIYGQVVAVVFAYVKDAQNINLAVPINDVKTILSKI